MSLIQHAGQRVSAFLLELEDELVAKDSEIEALKAQLADRSSELPAGLRELISLQLEQLTQTRALLGAIECPVPVSSNAADDDARQLRAALEAERQEHGEQSARVGEELETVREAARMAQVEVVGLRHQIQSDHDAHQQHIARLITDREAQEAKQATTAEAEALHKQLEQEREAHQQAIAKLNEDLEAARVSEASLEAALMEQRGALQRIEAKFSLYSAAVAKLAEPPEPRRAKLLQSSKQLSQRKPRTSGYSLG